MTLMRFDPFRELDRLVEQTLSVGARPPARQGGDEVLSDERPPGEFARHLFLGSVPAQEAPAAATEPAPA